jgi:hydrogenase maturation protein HypF
VEEPTCVDESEARQKLLPYVDFFLLHNRCIVNKVDDSVVRLTAGLEGFGLTWILNPT